MSKTVICRIIPTAAQKSPAQKHSNSAGNIVVLEVHPASGGASWRLTAAKSQDLKLQYGDKIKCISGTAAALINPGSPAGIFILCERFPFGGDPKHRTELEINDETTKAVHRGEISVTKDIGTVLTGGTSSTR